MRQGGHNFWEHVPKSLTAVDADDSAAYRAAPWGQLEAGVADKRGDAMRMIPPSTARPLNGGLGTESVETRYPHARAGLRACNPVGTR